MKALIIVLLFTMNLSAAEEVAKPKNLPYGVRSAQKDYRAAVDKAEKAYQAAMAKALAAYKKDMEKEQLKATKAGKLDLAIYIRKEAEAAELLHANADSLQPKTKPKPKAKPKGPDFNAMAEALEGTWRGVNGYGPYTFDFEKRTVTVQSYTPSPMTLIGKGDTILTYENMHGSTVPIKWEKNAEGKTDFFVCPPRMKVKLVKR